MGLLPGGLDEVLGLEALAHEAALHVHLDHQNGVDVAVGDGLFQLFEAQFSCHEIRRSGIEG